MSWIPLTIFMAVMLIAFYIADQLDKREESERQRLDNMRAKKYSYQNSERDRWSR